VTDRRAIARLQTPPGRGGIAVVALTGEDRNAILAKVFQPLASHVNAPADAIQLGKLIDDAGEALDEVIVARSDQGAVEINIHGGPAVARAVLERLAELGAQLAPAQPSADESFIAAHPDWDNPAIGREMLDILPAAASELVVTAISRQWSAGLSALVSDSAVTSDQLRQAAERLEIMRKLLDPPDVVLVGPPNVGKSTLANILVGRAVSIVHHTAGTTRDWVREQAILDGVPIWLTDTAGLFEFPDDPYGVEAESVRRARSRAEQADLVLLISAGDTPTETPDWLHAKNILHLAAKSDLAPPEGDFDLTISAETGDGLDDLRHAILTALGLADINPTAPAAFTQRHADLLTLAADALDQDNGPAATDAIDNLLRQIERPQ
jgi:tRNA modification GTPase